MPLEIDWQASKAKPSHSVDIPCFDAELRLSFIGDILYDASWQLPTSSCEPLSEQALQIQNYLLNPERHALKICLQRHHSQFFHRTWAALLAIPVGETNSYSDLAKQLGSGPRAVAMACRNNPYAGIIPCHRVTAKSGIGGFMGFSDGPFVQLKQRILHYEKSIARP